MEDQEGHNDLVDLTAEIVASYVTQNRIGVDEIPELIRTVHTALAGVDTGVSAPARSEPQKPAVPISRSVQDDYIVCLEDGKRLKMLKRYLRARYDMSPDEYRRKWNLPHDYPMVAPAYAQRRSDFAKQIGLGTGVRRKGGDR